MKCKPKQQLNYNYFQWNGDNRDEILSNVSGLIFYQQGNLLSVLQEGTKFNCILNIGDYVVWNNSYLIKYTEEQFKKEFDLIEDVTTKSISKKLDGLDYENFQNELSKMSKILKENNLVIVYGYSDDLIEFEGSIDDEVGFWKNCSIPITKEGICYNECKEDDCPYFKEKLKSIPKIIVTYNKFFKFEVPFKHEKFFIITDDEESEAVAFSLDDIETNFNEEKFE